MNFTLGSISERIRLWSVTIFFLQFLIVIGLLGYRSWMDSSSGCISCHSNKERMEKLGYPQFYMTPEQVAQETKHKYVKCHECHLGNGSANDPETAHKGMLRTLFVSKSGGIIKRKSLYDKPDPVLNRLMPSGDDELVSLLPKLKTRGELFTHPEVRNLLWHDRDSETLNFDPEIAEKTCAKRGCHEEELKQFRNTIMARNLRQRTMRTWLRPYGPHNCGPSFADLPPVEMLKSSGFDFKNTGEITKELNINFTKQQAIAKQKFCNVCHPGCLDCHYAPGKNNGVHSFARVPDSYSCLGWGRSNTICHAGAMHSRRGETYIGGDYSIPFGMEPDVHFKKNIHCIDCHGAGPIGMGDAQRKATCQDCHVEIEEAFRNGLHKNLTCTACHVTKAGGYQVTVWGPGLVGKKSNPFTKYSLYYGIQSPPVLIKDQKGSWFPVKVWPHSVGNIKPSVRPSPRLLFRWPDGETRDAYHIIGTFDGLPGNNNHLLWVQIEEIAHPIGRSRDCKSCHSRGQVTLSIWEFQDDQGAEPFEGSYRIIADSSGLRITGLTSNTPIRVVDGYKLEDFASWLYLKDKWIIPGDFSIKTDPAKYRQYLHLYKGIKSRLSGVQKRLKGADEEAIRDFKIRKGIVLHNPYMAQEMHGSNYE